MIRMRRKMLFEFSHHSQLHTERESFQIQKKKQFNPKQPKEEKEEEEKQKNMLETFGYHLYVDDDGGDPFSLFQTKRKKRIHN